MRETEWGGSARKQLLSENNLTADFDSCVYYTFCTSVNRCNDRNKTTRARAENKFIYRRDDRNDLLVFAINSSSRARIYVYYCNVCTLCNIAKRDGKQLAGNEKKRSTQLNIVRQRENMYNVYWLLSGPRDLIEIAVRIWYYNILHFVSISFALAVAPFRGLSAAPCNIFCPIHDLKLFWNAKLQK